MQCPETVLAHRKSHGAERPERRERHDDLNDPKKCLGELIDQLDDRPAPWAESGQPHAKQHGKEQYLERLAFGESAHHRLRE